MSALDSRPGSAVAAGPSGATTSAPFSVSAAPKRLVSESRAGFVHLRLHSEYSIVDGLVRIYDAVAAARADKMPAVALTDLAHVCGRVKFYTGAGNAGV